MKLKHLHPIRAFDFCFGGGGGYAKDGVWIHGGIAVYVEEGCHGWKKMYPQAKASRVKDFTNNYRAAPDDSNQGGLPLFNCLTFIVMVHHVTIEIDPVSGSKFSYIRT